MKTYFLILVLLFALTNSEGNYTITKPENGKCDTEGNGILESIITSENPITEPLKFSLKLIGLDEIAANCETQDDSSDSLIPNKASDSIAESEFPFDTMEEESPSLTPASGIDSDTNHNQDQNPNTDPESGGGPSLP